MSNNTLLITLAQPKPSETETFHSYVGASTELALEAGGEVSSRFGVRQLIGDTPAAIFGFATFPSAEAITTMFDSPAYQALVPSREQSIDAVNAYIVDETPITELADPPGAYLVVVAAPNPEAMEDLQAYQAGSGPIFAKHGGKPAAQLPVSDRPVGDTPAAFVAVLEFPSAEAAEAVFEDPDYQPLIEVRDRGLAALNVYVTN
ncbi:MAG: DUF1330 domain-containing protein [Acidimicrobiales bacterium]